jgi:hypothetical protein
VPHDGVLLGLLEAGGDAARRGAELAAASTGGDVDSWPLRRLDRVLLELHRELVGDHLVAFARCPECGEGVELEFSAGELIVLLRAAETEPIALSDCGWEIELRAPSVAGVRAAAAIGDPERAAQHLARACVVRARRSGRQVGTGRLPRAALDAIDTRLAELDPFDGPIELACPGCGRRWAELFDVSAFVVAELEAECRSLLAEIHLLASAYGWSEDAILGLPRSRRRHYVSLVTA